MSQLPVQYYTKSGHIVRASEQLTKKISLHAWNIMDVIEAKALTTQACQIESFKT